MPPSPSNGAGHAGVAALVELLLCSGAMTEAALAVFVLVGFAES
jgi:hypothetical protein